MTIEKHDITNIRKRFQTETKKHKQTSKQSLSQLNLNYLNCWPAPCPCWTVRPPLTGRRRRGESPVINCLVPNCRTKCCWPDDDHPVNADTQNKWRCDLSKMDGCLCYCCRRLPWEVRGRAGRQPWCRWNVTRQVKVRYRARLVHRRRLPPIRRDSAGRWWRHPAALPSEWSPDEKSFHFWSDSIECARAIFQGFKLINEWFIIDNKWLLARNNYLPFSWNRRPKTHIHTRSNRYKQ